jgi:hypothetical protein
MIYCVISLILYKFVMSDRLESFSSKMIPKFLKINLNLFKFHPKFLIYRQVPKKFSYRKGKPCIHWLTGTDEHFMIHDHTLQEITTCFWPIR